MADAQDAIRLPVLALRHRRPGYGRLQLGVLLQSRVRRATRGREPPSQTKPSGWRSTPKPRICSSKTRLRSSSMRSATGCRCATPSRASSSMGSSSRRSISTEWRRAGNRFGPWTWPQAKVTTSVGTDTQDTSTDGPLHRAPPPSDAPGLFGMSVITFALSRMVPGNPARLLAGPHARQEQVDAACRALPPDGADSRAIRGLHVGTAARRSRTLGHDAASCARGSGQFLPATVELTATRVPDYRRSSASRSESSRRQSAGGLFDHASRLVSIAGVSLPIFWLGLVLQVLFYKHLGFLPIGGRLGTLDIAPPRVTGAYLIDSLLAGDLSLFRSSAVHLILPALTLAAGAWRLSPG